VLVVVLVFALDPFLSEAEAAACAAAAAAKKIEKEIMELRLIPSEYYKIKWLVGLGVNWFVPAC
jgi:hypothetical protein